MPGQTLQSPNGTSSATHLHKNTSPTRLAASQAERLRSHTALHPILVTDDDAMSRTLYRALFQHEGLTHLDTRDSREALCLCRKHPVSLVISDIVKPNMNGLEMLERLRVDASTQHLPLLFITGSSHLREVAMHSGANGFLSKPCHPNEIMHEIWRLLQKELE